LRGQDYLDRERFLRAREALLSARPSDRGVMAAQLRFLATASSAGDDPKDRAALKHIGGRLEAMAKRA
jgi:hypothetical protein